MYDRKELPRRPDIPAPLYALIGVVAVERAMLAEGKLWACGFAGRVVVATSALLLVTAVLVRELRPTCVLLMISLACALSLSSLCLARVDAASKAMGKSAISRWWFRTEGDATETSRGFRSRADALWEGKTIGSVWLLSAESLEADVRLRCVGSFDGLGDDGWSVSSRMQGVCGTVHAMRIIERVRPEGIAGLIGKLRSNVLKTLEPEGSDERALLAGCVCGWRAGLRERGLDDLFARCGTAHLVAVSGGHLSVLLGLLEAALMACALRPRWRFAYMTVASGAFVLLCGVPPSAVRAWAMTTTSLLGNLAGRRSHSLSAVCIVGLVMALVDPSLSGSLGFVLSVTSVCGLCVFSPYATYALECTIPHMELPRCVPAKARRRIAKVRVGVRQSMAASVVALLVTLPFVADAFGEVSLVGPLANVLIATPFTLMVATGIIAGTLWLLPPLQAVTLCAADLLAKVVLWALRVLDALPIPVVQLDAGGRLGWIVWMLLVATLVWWPKLSPRRLRLGVGVVVLAITCFVARWRFFAPARICVLDVGQGDAILVQDGSHAVLVDAGPDKAVLDALSREHVTHLDAVVITHLHDDHFGGVLSFEGRVTCDEVIVVEGVAKNVAGELANAVVSLCSEGAKEVSYRDTLRVGGFTLEVVSPIEAVEGDENADSLELLVHYDEDGRSLTALLTGDAERNETGAALARGDLCDIDLLKVGHHGSDVSISAEEARALDPEVSVASAGEHNRYGHPDPVCVGILEGVGSEFICTKDVGDVDVRPGTDGPIVRTQRPSRTDLLVSRLQTVYTLPHVSTAHRTGGVYHGNKRASFGLPHRRHGPAQAREGRASTQGPFGAGP